MLDGNFSLKMIHWKCKVIQVKLGARANIWEASSVLFQSVKAVSVQIQIQMLSVIANNTPVHDTLRHGVPQNSTRQRNLDEPVVLKERLPVA